MHEGQLRVATADVARLVADQVPRLAGLAVRPVDSSGTVNAIFRVGDRHCARFPLVAGDVDEVRAQLETEADAARLLSGRTRFRTPEPVAIGEPGPEYTLPWSVQTWLTGRDATHDDTRRESESSDAFADDLAELVLAVREIPTGGTSFTGPGRGGDLPDHDAWVQECLRRSAGLVDVARLGALWERLRDLPAPGGPQLMTHGDLIPGNVLVADGRLAGVLDVGGLRPTDPSLELVGAWHLLDARRRRRLRATLGCDDLEWARGAAWALEQALGAGWYYRRTNPTMSAMGLRTLERLLADGP
jgi:aminoglycoside phosphotransferase (APT) family kinase protein